MGNSSAGLSPKKQELLKLLVQDQQRASHPQLCAHKWQGSRPLSFAQQRLWFLDQWQPGTISYNIPALARLTGPLNVELLQHAFWQVLNRHEVLRGYFVSGDGECEQMLVPAERFEISVEDISPYLDWAAEARLRATQQFRKPFDLAEGPLLRASLYRASSIEHYLALTFHHILTDAWSFSIFFRELGEFYSALIDCRTPDLPEILVQYSDFAYWQRQMLETESARKQLEYWREQLSGSLPLLDLHVDRPRPALQTFAGAQLVHRMSKEFSDRLRAFSRAHNVTLFMLLLAGFRAVLGRFTGQDDIIVGTPIAGRTRVETEKLIGFFINTLALRLQVPYDITFKELLGRIKETCLGALANQDVPFEKLVQELHPDRDVSRPPIFQVLFSLQNVPAQTLSLPSLQVEITRLESPSSKFELTFDVFDRPEGLACLVEYNTDLLDASTVERIVAGFERLLMGAVANADQQVWRLPLISEHERRQTVQEWNQTDRSFPQVVVHELITEQARKRPGQEAVRCGDRILTYFELEKRSNQLARALCQSGVKRESLVGVLAGRSERMPVALLAVLKAGGAYVPLDPAYPKERIRYMVEDSGCTVVIAETSLMGIAQDLGCATLCLDETWSAIRSEEDTPLKVLSDPKQLAYVIYTSGSTGKPKGVMIEHGALVNFLTSMVTEPGIVEQDRLLAVTTLSFDISGLEMYLPLIVGGKIEIATQEETIDPDRLQRKLAASGATVMQATPVTWRMLVQSGWKGKPNLKVLCGGEGLGSELADALVERVAEVWNVYGPTETTIWSAVGRLKHNGAVRIGRPVANTTMYVVDPRTLEVQPVGVAGELLIGGVGLARGYLGRPELTAEKFITSPFKPGERLYRTGDLARWRPEGELECLGRLDQQVKIRGYRIELGEIEAVLGEHEDVVQVAVVALGDRPGYQRLVAYVVASAERTPSTVELRELAQRQLPQYMVPASFVFLPKLPQTPNGKVDRRALPAPEEARPDRQSGYVPPRNEMERTIANIWQKALHVGQIGREDNFFDLGGHSLLMVQVYSALRKHCSTDLSLIDLFRYPTIKSLSEYLRNNGKADTSSLQRTHDRAAMRHAAMHRHREVRTQR